MERQRTRNVRYWLRNATPAGALILAACTLPNGEKTADQDSTTAPLGGLVAVTFNYRGEGSVIVQTSAGYEGATSHQSVGTYNGTPGAGDTVYADCVESNGRPVMNPETKQSDSRWYHIAEDGFPGAPSEYAPAAFADAQGALPECP